MGQHVVLLCPKNVSYQEINSDSDIQLIANMEAVTRQCSQKLKLIFFTSVLLVFVILVIWPSNIIEEPSVENDIRFMLIMIDRRNKLSFTLVPSSFSFFVHANPS